MVLFHQLLTLQDLDMGLKMLRDVDLNNNRNLFVIAAILISGIGGLKIHITDSIQITTIATALILGIVTNNILNLIEKRQKQ